MEPISKIKSFLLKMSLFQKQKATPAIPSNDNSWDREFAPEQPFTDSWENVTWRVDDLQSAFTDKAFQ